MTQELPYMLNTESLQSTSSIKQKITSSKLSYCMQYNRLLARYCCLSVRLWQSALWHSESV